MYLNPTSVYYEGSEARCRQEDYLILLQSKALPLGPDNFRAIVRKVALKQFGHFMMGNAVILRNHITVEGDYGNNGLPVTVPHPVYEVGKPVPYWLYDMWNHGDGWNGKGSEGDALREWAFKYWNELIPSKRKIQKRSAVCCA